MRIERFLVYALVALVGLYLLAAILYAIPMIDGLIDDAMEVKFDRPNPSIVADCGNGLNAAGIVRQNAGDPAAGGRVGS